MPLPADTITPVQQELLSLAVCVKYKVILTIQGQGQGVPPSRPRRRTNIAGCIRRINAVSVYRLLDMSVSWSRAWEAMWDERVVTERQRWCPCSSTSLPMSAISVQPDIITTALPWQP